jgi:hypothetical protein
MRLRSGRMVSQLGERRRWTPKRDHRVFTQAGMFAPQSLVGVHNDSLINVERALKERIYFVKGPDGSFQRPPQPVVGAFSDMDDFKRRLLAVVPRVPALSMEEFPYRYEAAAKRNVYIDALHSLESFGLREKDAELRAFVKAEKLDLMAKANPVPRLIQPRSPRYNLSLGVELSHREHLVYEAMDKVFNSKVVCKGLNARRRGKLISEKWGKFTRPVAIGMDASRFDQHVSTEALEWEHDFYEKLATTPESRRKLKWMLGLQRKNSGLALARDGCIRYETQGCRASGDMNTAFGNILLMCGMFYAFMAQFPGVKYEYVNDGDDCVLFLEKGDMDKVLPSVPDWFRNHGFTMVVEPPVYELEKVEFCQSQPVWTPEGYLMVRNPRKAAVKDSISLVPLSSETVWRRWMRSVGECGLSLTGGIPVCQDIYQSYIKHASGATRLYHNSMQSGIQMLSRGMHRKYQRVHERTRFSFDIAFGITPDEQLAFEEKYRTMDYTYVDPPLRFESLSLPWF